MSYSQNCFNELVNSSNLKCCVEFFNKQNPVASGVNSFNHDLQFLFDKLEPLANNPLYPNYSKMLYELMLEVVDIPEEEQLDIIVVRWSEWRGKLFSHDKAIDELYIDLELLLLWHLLCKSVMEQDFSNVHVNIMRSIIRRYGKLSGIWLYLCQVNGSEIKTSYTF